MSKSTMRILALAVCATALLAVPLLTSAYASGDASPSPPASTSTSPPTSASKNVKKQKQKKADKSSSIEDGRFLEGYRAAYATVYDRNDYATAIEQLKALGHDDNAAVANLIGYSYRKLSDYKVSQIWYERALKIDPDHVKTWQYYGLWQVEQGNRDQALYHLSRLAALAGTDSEEYRSLAAALEKPPGTGLVY
jgi:tetratricopeptide (TPR) repeat protein